MGVGRRERSPTDHQPTRTQVVDQGCDVSAGADFVDPVPIHHGGNGGFDSAATVDESGEDDSPRVVEVIQRAAPVIDERQPVVNRRDHHGMGKPDPGAGASDRQRQPHCWPPRV